MNNKLNSISFKIKPSFKLINDLDGTPVYIYQNYHENIGIFGADGFEKSKLLHGIVANAVDEGLPVLGIEYDTTQH